MLICFLKNICALDKILNRRQRSTLMVYLICLLSSPIAFAAAPTYTLESGQWNQLVIPADSSTITLRDIFTDDLPAEQYNSSWFIYQWDNVASTYLSPELSASIPTGQGFWMIQNTGSPIVIDVDGLTETPLSSSSACPSSGGCRQVQLSTSSTNSSFSMIGSAMQSSVPIDALRFEANDGEGVCDQGCSHRTASESGFMKSVVWRFNPATQTYDDLANSGSLDPWESAWFQSTELLRGMTSSYYFPAPDRTEPEFPNGVCQNAPPLPVLTESDPNKIIVRVSTLAALNDAISAATPNTVVLIEPGRYELSSTLVVRQDNVTIRGNSNRCDAVRLVGQGMNNVQGADSTPHGIWTNADFLKVQNLTIENVYYHAISIDALAEAPQIYNVAMFDIGEQFVKVNAGTDGQSSNNGKLEYSVIKYTNGIPDDHGAGVGYTQGISIHGGKNWLIGNNRFESLSTPDTADYLWNPSVLVWNSASNTIVENNVFIDVDRAIAFGLQDRPDEHSGGIIRNNTVLMRQNLYSQNRKNSADAPIVIWSSPDTKVLHNTVLTNGNTPFAIELRFNSNGASLRNNLADAPIRDRSSNQYVDLDNVLISDSSIFKNPSAGDLRLLTETTAVVNSVPTLENALQDIDGQNRRANTTDAGADEFRPF